MCSRGHRLREAPWVHFSFTPERYKVPITPGQLGNNVRRTPLSSKRIADIFA
jgi:hypothetical protein